MPPAEELTADNDALDLTPREIEEKKAEDKVLVSTVCGVCV